MRAGSKHWRWVFAIVAASGGVAARAGDPVDLPAGVIARGHGFTLSREEFLAAWRETCGEQAARQGNPQACLPEHREAFLGNVLRYKVLVVEARRLRLQEDPEVVKVIDKLIVQKLVQDRFSAGKGGPGDRARQAADFDALVQDLRRRAEVQVDAEALADLPLAAPRWADPGGQRADGAERAEPLPGAR